MLFFYELLFFVFSLPLITTVFASYVTTDSTTETGQLKEGHGLADRRVTSTTITKAASVASQQPSTHEKDQGSRVQSIMVSNRN